MYRFATDVHDLVISQSLYTTVIVALVLAAISSAKRGHAHTVS
jgi:hypothetical protein